MSAIELSVVSKFPYQKLKQDEAAGFDDDYERESMILRSGNLFRFRYRRLHSRKRFKLKVPSLKKFLRRKVKVVSAVRFSCAKVLRRLKESKAHLGDLFAGNYVFMQISPTSFKCLDKSFKGTQDLHGFSSRYSVPRVA